MSAAAPVLAPRPGLTARDLAVGQVFATGTATLDRDGITAFARAFDPQPMHLDEAAAAGTLFGGLVASGWHVLALTMRLMVDAAPFGATPIIGAEVERLRFRRPVPPGTEVRVRARLEAIEAGASRSGHAAVRLTVETLASPSDEVLVTQAWKLLVPAG